MSRPTENRKDKTIKVRISEEMYERMRGKNMSEIIRNGLEKGFVPTKLSKEDSFVPTKYPYDIDKLIESLERLVDTGDLVIFGSEVVMNTGFNVPDELKDELKNLSNACDEKGISVKDALRKTAQSIWSIRQ